MKELYDRPIPGQDLARLLAMLRPFGNVAPEDIPVSLPKSVVEAYWRRKVHHERIGGGMQMSVDAMFAIMQEAGVTLPLPGDPPLTEKLLGKEYAPGTEIEVEWRNGWKLVEFRSADKRGIHVVMDGEDRVLELTRQTRLPELAEV